MPLAMVRVNTCRKVCNHDSSDVGDCAREDNHGYGVDVDDHDRDHHQKVI